MFSLNTTSIPTKRNKLLTLFQNKESINNDKKLESTSKNNSNIQVTPTTEFNKQFKGIDFEVIDMGSVIPSTPRPRTAPLTPDMIAMIDNKK